jgi:hypothetical protein
MGKRARRLSASGTSAKSTHTFPDTAKRGVEDERHASLLSYTGSSALSTREGTLWDGSTRVASCARMSVLVKSQRRGTTMDHGRQTIDEARGALRARCSPLHVLPLVAAWLRWAPFDEGFTRPIPLPFVGKPAISHVTTPAQRVPRHDPTAPASPCAVQYSPTDPSSSERTEGE